ncbi:MAG: methyltransferase domain-containing protein [Lachnospiraceae bacterium]|nr:methyltransferase domain-containing protein [Lachnospiraceae bacterium]
MSTSPEKKFGKRFGNLNSFKTSFFENNDGMLRMADGMAEILSAQPLRKTCKICGNPLSAESRPASAGRIPDETLRIKSHGLSYIRCEVCGHLNSEHEDTDDFANKVYVEDDYAKNYSEADKEQYQKRCELIYIPKAEFLRDSLNKEGISAESADILDIGAGCGYFVTAARSLGMKAEGIEVSAGEVEYGNKISGSRILTHVGLTDSIDYIRNTDKNIISAIGVLEHLTHLSENLAAIRNNDNIRYLYASVPMFSFSCAFEASHQDCYNRHMGGTHTHLFTNESIACMAESIGFEVAYEWRFGSDINDLYRFIMVELAKNDNKEFADYFAKKFTPLMDELQLVLDKSEFSSENHFILKKT